MIWRAWLTSLCADMPRHLFSSPSAWLLISWDGDGERAICMYVCNVCMYVYNYTIYYMYSTACGHGQSYTCLQIPNMLHPKSATIQAARWLVCLTDGDDLGSSAHPSMGWWPDGLVGCWMIGILRSVYVHILNYIDIIYIYIYIYYISYIYYVFMRLCIIVVGLVADWEVGGGDFLTKS